MISAVTEWVMTKLHEGYGETCSSSKNPDISDKMSEIHRVGDCVVEHDTPMRQARRYDEPKKTQVAEWISNSPERT